MLKKKNCYSSATLLRSLFEYQIELLYQAKDDKNLLERNKDAQKDQLSHLNAINSSKASEHKKMTNQQWFKTAVNKLKKALGKYKKNRIEGLCIKLGLQHDYDSYYRPLSRLAHPTITNYFGRFYDIKSNGVFIEKSSDGIDNEEMLPWLFLLSTMLCNATKCAHKIMPDCNIKAVNARLDKFCQDILKFHK